jgi:peroxiredoxin
MVRRQLSPRQPWLVAMCLAVLLLGAACASTIGPKATPKTDPAARLKFSRISGRMPALSGRALGGGELSPSDYVGKIVVVNFWASDCAPCRREEPELESLWQHQKDRGVTVIGVDYRDQPQAALAFRAEFGVTYPSLSDPSGELATAFGVPGLPTTIIVASSGDMQYRLVGAQTEATILGLINAMRTLS